MVIGLTGGIGCGKSTAAACFAGLGFQVVDADQLARQVLESPACVARLRARWGAACLGSAGVPDRRWIGTKVFADPAERAFLESVTHPEVARLRREATADPRRDYVVELPLLFEKELAAGFHAIVVVACSEEVRRVRLRARGLTDEEISARIASQLSLVEKVKRADAVFWNDGSAEFLREQVRLWVSRTRGA
ncbi:MAG: dephospho-CoA kinase [Verrucomicrobia bacterium]|nr:dephospho-CoA kinase [Verrucomicrobiota bacterium]